MTETLTGKQVLALLAQDEPPEIEYFALGEWIEFAPHTWHLSAMRTTECRFRIKPKPARRLSVTLASGEVVSWPEPVRAALEDEQEYWYVDNDYEVIVSYWTDTYRTAPNRLAFGNVHLTREAAQEHADALRKINTQEVGKC